MKQLIDNGRRTLTLTAVAGLLVLMTTFAVAADKVKPKDEAKLGTEIAMLDSHAKLPQAEKVVTDRLAKTFEIKSERITALKDKNLGYGEIATVLAFADKMSGGINETNLNRVLSLKQGNAGWPQIAQSLNVDLGKVADKVASIEEDTHKDIKKAAIERFETGRAGGGGDTSGAGAGGGNVEKSGESRY